LSDSGKRKCFAHAVARELNRLVDVLHPDPGARRAIVSVTYPTSGPKPRVLALAQAAILRAHALTGRRPQRRFCMTKLIVLEKTVCVMLRVSRWTGRSRLRVHDLGDAASKLPPEELASLGSLKLCDPKRLRRVAAIQRAAERDCADVCVRFLGGYATEESAITGLVEKLSKHQSDFLREADAISTNLQSVVDDWTARHPRYKSIIDEKVPDGTNVLRRYRFVYQAFRVGPASDELVDSMNGGLIEAANGLSGQLFKEIESKARQAWKSSYEGKVSVSRKALRPLKSIVRKLEALSYLDQRCQPIIQQFQRVLRSLPKCGPIEDLHLSAVMGLFKLVQSGNTMVSHGAALLQNQASAPATIQLFPDDEMDGNVSNDSDASDGEDGVDTVVEETVPHAPTPSHQPDSLWF